MRRPQDLYISLRTTIERRRRLRKRSGVNEIMKTYWIADIRGGDDAGIKEDGKELDNRVKVEEHEDLLAT